MQFLWIGWQTLILTGTIIYSHGAEEKDSISSSTSSADYNPNEDYPDNYPDYHDRDYPNPDYYDLTPDREGRSRKFPEDVPDVMSEENYLKQLRSTIPGIPGVDYPIYQSVPDTSFQCQDQRNPGFYGDVEAQCQVFHICQEDDRHDSFLCPVGTVFNQMNFICDWWFNFKCDDTPTFFHLNAQFYTSSGATPASVMIRETMKKMRRFTEGTKYKSSVMENSMRNTNTGFNKELKRMSMDDQFMKEMERHRIMNLFLPKMRPANFWRRLRATTSKDKKMNNNNANVSPTGPNVVLKNEDFKLLASTKHLDFANSDNPTTPIGTTELSPERMSTNKILETTSQVMNNTIQSNHTESILVFESTSNAFSMSNEIETENNDKSDASTSGSFNENGVNMSLTLPTASFDIHSISENITLNSVPIEITEEDFNDIMALIDLNIENSTDTLIPLTEEYIANQVHMESANISEANNLLSESPINSTNLPSSSPNTEFNIALYPPSTNNSSETLGNQTHVSVSVTIRARTGISRLKWRRVGQGKKRKNLKLENAPPNADADERRDSFMDIEYRKRPIRNKKLRSRIMWIPTKNNSLSRKSHWRIFLNSRPQNISTYSLRKEKEQIQKAQLTGDVKLPIKIQESKLEKEQMLKSELTGHVKSSIHIQEAEFEKNKNLNSNLVQYPKTALSNADSTSETLMTESTKVSFTLMAVAESTTSNSIDITSIKYNDSTADEEQNQRLELHQNLKDSEGTTDCEAICFKFLKSLGIENYSMSNITQTANVSEPYMSTTDAVKSDLFGRRSFLEISPSDQWTVKYDPDPNCDEDEDGNKILIRGWSVIIDSGSVTKEKTVKRRGCQNAFDDSKIIVMQNMLPDHETTPNENTPNAYGRGTNNKSNISFGSMDQQYWFTLVKNWLESSPKSKNGARSNTRWSDDKDEVKKEARTSNTNEHFPSADVNWMEINPSRSNSWPRQLPTERTQSRIQDYNLNSQIQNFGGQKKIRDLNDSPFTDGKHDRPDYRNPKNNGQVKRKREPKNSANEVYASRLNGFSDPEAKWSTNNGWQKDTSSSQSGRKEWQRNVVQKLNKDINLMDERWNNNKKGKQSGLNGKTRKNTESQNWTPSFSKGGDKKFRPRSGNQDWSSSESRNTFSVGRRNDWSESRSNQMHNTKKMKRDEDEWFMSSEENMRISPPQIDRSISKDDRSVWNSDQIFKTASSSKNAKAGFSSDRSDIRSWSSDNPNRPWSSDNPNKPWSSDNPNKPWSSDNPNKPRSSDNPNKPWSSDNPNKPRSSDNPNKPWSSDNPNKPWSSTKMQMDDKFDSRRKGSWSSDENVDESKKIGNGSKGGSWSSGNNNKNGRIPARSRDQIWDFDEKGIKRDDPRSGYSEAKMKSDWSSKPRDSQEDWPSTKGRGRDSLASFDKPNLNNRQDPDDWSSDNKPIPPFQDGRAWDMDDKIDSNIAPSGNKKGSSTKRSSKGEISWTSDDQQTKADWSSNKGGWSDRRKSQPRDSRKGSQNPPTDNRRRIDSAWPPSSDRSDWSKDSQRDISDWSEDDRQSRSDDWSSKNKGNIPSFNTDKDRGRDFKAPESRNSKDDWFNDNMRDNNDWHSDKRSNARDEGNKRGRSEGQKPSRWSSDDRQVSSDESDSQNDWFFDDQKDISDDKNSPKDWRTKSKNKSSGKSSWNDDDSPKASFGSKPVWDSKGSIKISNQKPNFMKGNKPASFRGQNGWNNPQIQTDQWKMDIPQDASDWSSSPPENKQASTKTKGKMGPIIQSRWEEDDRSSIMPNSPSHMDEDWPLNAPVKPGPTTGVRPDKDSLSWSDSRDSSEDWPSDNAGKSSWSSDIGGNRRSANKRSDSMWNQDTSAQANVKNQNPINSWNTKGRTKTAMVMLSTSKGTPGMMIKPWKDDTDQTKPTKNIKGGPAMKEEKIVWSVQISSNGETGNGWVPITLRPEFKKRVNQSRDQNNDKGAPMADDGWSGLEQKSNSWDSSRQDKMGQSPKFRTDMITESVPSSTQMLDSSDSHPFYIPVSNSRFKREAKPILRIRHHIRPRDNARTIYKVIRNGIELKSNQTNNDNRFYLASANILVGDNHSSRKQSSGFGNRHKQKLDIIGKREYNETIKNTVPSLIQIRNLKQENFTSKNAKRFKNIQDWDGLMQESETKESWSAPIDDSNVPASGWIPLFRVVKVPSRNSADLKKNISKSEEKNTEIKRIIRNESTVYNDAKIQQRNSSNFLVPRNTVIKNATFELPRTEIKNFKMENITVNKQVHAKQVNLEQEMKVGNQTLRIIPFSDIMKQLREKPTEFSSTDLTTSTVSSTNTEDEWNIPITASPKTYGIKLVNSSEMQNQNHTNSWTFTKRTPKGREAWILVKENQFENKTVPNENRNSTNRNLKATENDGYIKIPYKIIVGNRTVETEESPQLSEIKRIGNNFRNKPNNPPNPQKKEFSFDLKNWQKDSGWTPLLRAVGSVKSKKIDNVPSANKSTGED